MSLLRGFGCGLASVGCGCSGVIMYSGGGGFMRGIGGMVRSRTIIAMATVTTATPTACIVMRVAIDVVLVFLLRSSSIGAGGRGGCSEVRAETREGFELTLNLIQALQHALHPANALFTHHFEVRLRLSTDGPTRQVDGVCVQTLFL